MMLTGRRTHAWMNVIQVPCSQIRLALIGILIIHYYSHDSFAHKLRMQILRIGDPNVHFRAAAAKSYETTEDIGKPDWNLFLALFWPG